jgi:protein arginine kinase activator
VDGVAREVHLCEECASRNGINIEMPMSMTDLLAGFQALEEVDAGSKSKKCPLCGMRLRDFQKTSRLGCPACYDTFRGELKRLLAGMQKGEQHAGKQPAWATGPADSSSVLALRKELETAVAGENYEEAARLRDRILMEKARAESEVQGKKNVDNR